MESYKSEDGKGGILAILIILIILILAFGLYIFVADKNGMEKIFSKVEEEEVSLTEYIVYGTHLNIKGEVKTETVGIKGVNLVFMTAGEDEKKIKLKFELDGDKIKFHTSDLINTGIDLEEMDQNKYYMIIEAEYTKEPKYFSIKNSTEYGEVMYYTITKNNVNHKIDIDFDTYKKEEKSTNYMFMDVKPTHLPKDVYDIVIDPGHGGADNGAEGSGYTEAELTLEYGNMVKAELEKLGLKVKMTRDGTENEEDFNVYTVYDKDGRVNVVGDSKAKYVLSIHLNSIDVPNSQKGVEIYAPTKMDLGLAKAFAKNIVNYRQNNIFRLRSKLHVS